MGGGSSLECSVARLCGRGWRVQQPAKLPTIGFLGSGTLTAQGLWLAAFVQRLHELGWIEGRNLAMEYRWAEGSSDRATQFAAEFVQLKVDVICDICKPNGPRSKACNIGRPDHLRGGGGPASLRVRRDQVVTLRAYRFPAH